MSELDLAGWLLVGGLVTFATGAGLPPQRVWTASEEVRMDLIARHTARWIAASIGLGAGVVLTGAGLALLALALRATGAGPAAIAGTFGFAFGGVLFAFELTFRATVMVGAAAGPRPLPNWYPPLRSWAGAAFSAYMPLAYLALVATGAALVQTSLVPRGLGWVAVAFGALGALVYVARVPRFLWSLFDIPGLLYLVTGAIGVALLFA
jgi:hypothetical protein